MEESISVHDRNILRELAKIQVEYANSEKNKETIKQWHRHNSLDGERPMIHLEMGTFQHEIIPKRLRCHGKQARNVETRLYSNFLNHELFGDDHPVHDYFGIGYNARMIPFGLNPKIEHAKNTAGNNLGHHFVSQIKDLEDDFHLLGTSKIEFDREASTTYFRFIEDVFGDILPAKMSGGGIVSGLTQNLVHLMSMETMFFPMYDYPELFHKMMESLTNDTLRYYRFLEKEGLILSTVEGEHLCQGSWCFNNELRMPKTENESNFLTTDIWGYMDSQETVGLSPEMFDEFIFPHYKRIADQYGLLSYGCCEPVDKHWALSLSKLENLRKISISPWCDEDIMAEALAARKVIFHRKPSPNFLGVGKILDEDGLRNSIRKTLKTAKDCKIEITQRDVYTIHNDEAKARRYIDILKEEIVNIW